MFITTRLWFKRYFKIWNFCEKLLWISRLRLHLCLPTPDPKSVLISPILSPTSTPALQPEQKLSKEVRCNDKLFSPPNSIDFPNPLPVYLHRVWHSWSRLPVHEREALRYVRPGHSTAEWWMRQTTVEFGLKQRQPTWRCRLTLWQTMGMSGVIIENLMRTSVS